MNNNEIEPHGKEIAISSESLQKQQQQQIICYTSYSKIKHNNVDISKVLH